MKNSKLPKAPFPLFAISALLLTSCTGGGPGDEQDLVNALSRDDAFTTEEAECIAEKVFIEYGNDEETLKKISEADAIDELQEGENKVDGFTQDYDLFQEECTN